MVPAFYEEIAQALEKVYGVPAESIEFPALLHFGSWVGGDMDGNPDVHAKTIRETLARQQRVIVNAYFKDCQTLAQRLSQSASRTSVSPELSKRIDEYMVLLPGARAITPARHDRMPYRVFFAQIGERLRHTYDGRPNGYQNLRQFRADVRLIATSLQANKGANAGLFYVQRLLRRIDTFGFHLATLDVRQHAIRAARCGARGAWTIPTGSRARAQNVASCWPMRWERTGAAVLSSTRSASARSAVFDAIMQGRHRYGPAAVGYFIVSGATGADDVLAALLLARWAEAYDKHTGEVALDIAPQFESLDALERCGEDDAGAAGRSPVSAASRSARPHAVRADRILRRQQGRRACARHASRLIRRSAHLRRRLLPPMSVTSYSTRAAEASLAAEAVSTRS